MNSAVSHQHTILHSDAIN